MSELFSTRLLRSNDAERLLGEERIKEYNSTHFEEFPDCFHEPTWKNLFFRNERLLELRNAQLNEDFILQQVLPRRQAYR